MNAATLFTKTFAVALAKIVVGVGMIAFGHADGGVVLIGSALGNITMRDAITKAGGK